MLYVAGSIQPRALDSKLPLSAVFPLFSLSPQASPRCYLPIVPPSRSFPQPRFATSYTTPSSSSVSAASAASASSSRPPCCGSATRSRYNFPNDYYSRVPPIGATSSAQVPGESRNSGSWGVRGYRWNELRIHFPKPVTSEAQISRSSSRNATKDL